MSYFEQLYEVHFNIFQSKMCIKICNKRIWFNIYLTYYYRYTWLNKLGHSIQFQVLSYMIKVLFHTIFIVHQYYTINIEINFNRTNYKSRWEPYPAWNTLQFSTGYTANGNKQSWGKNQDIANMCMLNFVLHHHLLIQVTMECIWKRYNLHQSCLLCHNKLWKDLHLHNVINMFIAYPFTNVTFLLQTLTLWATAI